MYEITIGVDRVRLGQIFLNESHDVRHLELGLVSDIIYAIIIITFYY